MICTRVEIESKILSNYQKQKTNSLFLEAGVHNIRSVKMEQNENFLCKFSWASLLRPIPKTAKKLLFADVCKKKRHKMIYLHAFIDQWDLH